MVDRYSVLYETEVAYSVQGGVTVCVSLLAGR